MKRLFISLLLIVAVITSCNRIRPGTDQGILMEAGKEKVNHYSINCYYDEVEKLIKGYQQITYHNNEELILEDVFMHLYPNSFESEEIAPFSRSEFHLAYPLGFDPGFIEIHSVKTEGKQGSWEYTDEQRRGLRVVLPRPLAPGQSTVIELYYTVKLPRCNGRFGYSERMVKAANWYPIVAVFDEHGWNLDPYYSIGDPFYSDISNYRVTVMLPDGYTVATTGEVIKTEKQGNRLKKWSLSADNVRDFVWLASREFKTDTARVEHTTIRSYHFDNKSGDKAIEVAKEAIEIFNHLFGRYPYSNYSVVAADFFIGGMEYPGLVLISSQLYDEANRFSLEYVVAHETAHQWWYGIVGNNQVTEAWLDEGLTEYSTILYYEQKYGAKTARTILQRLIEDRYRKFSAEGRMPRAGIYDSLDKYSDAEEYSTMVYCGGALVFDEIRRIMGDDNFFNALRTYTKSFAYENATAIDLIRIMEDLSGMELKDKVTEWIINGVQVPAD
jgi:aminopeptidase N